MGRLMGWETFTPLQRSTATPLVTVAANGTNLTLNRAAFQALGQPLAVVLLWDAATRTIGLEPAAPDEPDCYAVTRVGGAAGRLTVRAFLRHYGLHTGKARHFVAEMRDGVLCATVGTQPGPEQG